MTETLPRIQEILNARSDAAPDVFAGALPFALNDTTVGAENELQAVVAGAREHVDFPITIEESNDDQNLLTRAGTGETSRRSVADIENFTFYGLFNANACVLAVMIFITLTGSAPAPVTAVNHVLKPWVPVASRRDPHPAGPVGGRVSFTPAAPLLFIRYTPKICSPITAENDSNRHNYLFKIRHLYLYTNHGVHDICYIKIADYLNHYVFTRHLTFCFSKLPAVTDVPF